MRPIINPERFDVEAVTPDTVAVTDLQTTRVWFFRAGLEWHGNPPLAAIILAAEHFAKQGA